MVIFTHGQEEAFNVMITEETAIRGILETVPQKVCMVVRYQRFTVYSASIDVLENDENDTD